MAMNEAPQGLTASPRPIWVPSPNRVEQSAMTEFTRVAHRITGRPFGRYADLHRWSVDSPQEFWSVLWNFLDIRCQEPFHRVLSDPLDVAHSEWFSGVQLNPVQTLLRRCDDAVAIVYRDESGGREIMSWAELQRQVAAVSEGFRAMGLRPGDRVVAICSNRPQAMVALLATAACGGIWSICSPEFGAAAIVDRFLPLAPQFLIAADAHQYKGRSHDDRRLVEQVIGALPTLERVVAIRTQAGAASADDLFSAATDYQELVKTHSGARLRLHVDGFHAPGCVLFSSGTTGPPKSIVHSLSAVVLQLLKEHRLHYDLRAGGVFYQHTSTSWNMWYWLVAALAAEAVVVLRDGSPFYPNDVSLLQMLDEERIDVFGVSPRYLAVLQERGIRAEAAGVSLKSLATILSTGAPLPPDSFRYVYEQLKSDVCLSSISGGTEIMTCFYTGNPNLPVHSGQLQCPALGMQPEVFDDDGRSVHLLKGELVCTRAFPSRPVGFWSDDTGERYRTAYFERYPNVWHHGDYAETTASGGMVIHGRSDATLKPGGIRVGTGELYPRINAFAEVEDSIVVGRDTDANDVEVVLFVKLAAGRHLDDDLRQRIRDRVRAETSPWHVPARVFQVADIPYTQTGKLAEVAVRRVINGESVANATALRNPEALLGFRPTLHFGSAGAEDAA